MSLPNPDQPPELVCSACQNRRKAGPATEVMSCGDCCYHKTCRRGAGHCECGFPSTVSVEVGVQCIACTRPVSTNHLAEFPLFCALHEDQALDQFRLYGRKGIDVAPDARGKCTSYKVLSGNGVLHRKVNVAVGTVLAQHAIATALRVDSLICLYNDEVLTLATRMRKEMDKTPSVAKYNLAEVASDLFPLMQQHAVRMFQRQYYNAGIFEHGFFTPTSKSKYATAIVCAARLQLAITPVCLIAA